MSHPLSDLAALLVGGPTAVVAKATLVLASAALAAVVLRRASAAFRHLIWLLGLSACAALALLSSAAPTIAVDVAVPLTTPRTSRISERDIATTVVSVAGPSSVPLAIAGAPEMSEPVERARLSPAIMSHLPSFALTAWLLGCLTILARLALGHRNVRRLIDAADPVLSGEWTASLEAASVDLGYTGNVELLTSETLAAPITSGFFRPVIVLPAESSSWDAERRRIVLTHELAHIARLDYAAQLVATVACALFWFHPAVWFAASRLRAEAEHAADDRVLGAGTLGVTYATHLLELARGDHSTALSSAASVGMIRSSHLEGRFRAMLDSTRSRTAVTPRFQAAAATLMLCAMIPAAGLRTVARAGLTSAGLGTPVATSVTTSTHFPDVVTVAGTSVTVAVPTRASVLSKIQSADDSTFEKTIEASAGERLSLDLPTGATVVLHGWDEPRIRLVARLSGPDWRDTRVALTRASGGVRLRSDFASRRENQMTSHRFELWVPRHMDVSMSSAGGSVAINNLSGEFSGQTGGGGITIEGARGHASLSTGGGPVSVTNSDLSGTVSTGGGSVEISNVTGGLRGSSGGGDVVVSGGLGATSVSGRTGGAVSTIVTNDGRTIRVDEPGAGFGGRTTATSSTNITTERGQTITTTNADGIATTVGVGQGRGFGFGGFSISKAGGEIVIDDLPHGGALNTGGGQIVVRSSGGSVSASTGGGDVELQRVAGDVNVSTGAGDVQITVVNSNGTEHSVDVYSGKGRVVLYLPANIDARFELETAYTDNFDRRTSIESDFALDRSETGAWDNQFGTPRKYVRASGVFGRGTGLVRVRTVNGDVIVRRR